MEALLLERENKISDFSPLNIQRIPRYATGSISIGDGISPGQDIYRIREGIVYELMTGVAMVYREGNIAVRFNELVSQVEEDCLLLSSPSQIALHPSYQEIVGMGKSIIPLLIEKLDETPMLWFWALQAISGTNPVPKSHKGDIPKMVKEWKNWFNEKS